MQGNYRSLKYPWEERSESHKGNPTPSLIYCSKQKEGQPSPRESEPKKKLELTRVETIAMPYDSRNSLRKRERSLVKADPPALLESFLLRLQSMPLCLTHKNIQQNTKAGKEESGFKRKEKGRALCSLNHGLFSILGLRGDTYRAPYLLG